MFNLGYAVILNISSSSKSVSHITVTSGVLQYQRVHYNELYSEWI